MSVTPQIQFQQITDPVIRRNFQNISQFFQSAGFAISGLDFMEIVFSAKTDHGRPAHSLGVIPQDVMVTHLTGTGSVTFNFGLFDTTNLDISASGPCRVRFLFGSLKVGQQTPAQSEAQTFNPGG